MSSYLVQVSKDIGYANIITNGRYENDSWMRKRRDTDHGEVNPGDDLLIYCTGDVPNHGKSLAFSVAVRAVSPDRTTFELDEPRWFPRPIQRREILGMMDRQELPGEFRNCGTQGFNIIRLDPRAAGRVLAQANAEWTVDQDDVVKKTPIRLLAKDLLLSNGFLKNINSLLEDKRQVIFQGPPGTGKTYVAQKLANYLAGSDSRVTLVQFHPSYSYEDFVQGFRPTIKSGQPGFELRDGPLLRAAECARSEPHAKHFLVIDEINRGNLARVFGELYFLLEYRDSEMTLQYSDKLFSLPDNLYIIGTMNTADRSIALVDLALRRRFYFVEFHPDDEPVKSVLRKWLRANAPAMEWVADVVDAANEKLRDDRHAAIGPSYFIKDGLDEADVERIWKHSVLPYIEERLFGNDERIREFALDRLRPTATTTVHPDSATDGEGSNQIDGGLV